MIPVRGGTSTVLPAADANPLIVGGNFKYEYRGNKDKGFPNKDGSALTGYGNRFLVGVTFDWKANDSINFFGRVAGEVGQLGNTTHDSNPNDFKMDEFGVKTTLNGWKLSVGRQGAQLGQGGVLYAGVDWACTTELLRRNSNNQ